MSRITTDILSLERIEKMQSQGGEKVDLVRIVNDMMPTYFAQAEMKSQILHVDLPETPVYIVTDSAQIHEAIGNLISNALKYTQDEGKINVRVKQTDGKAVVEVQDNGFGIPNDQQKKLFQPFFRVKTDETLQVDGTGLGLYLIKRIVERFNGSIIFSSTYGEGSLFGFRLPVA